jgi:EAL domain-containing protein (putative c-di-GMP-specific phosphodiesterase class I)
LAQACRQAASWQADGTPIGMSVNVSAQQLDSPGFADSVATCLRESGLPPAMLMLELTESVLAANTQSIRLTMERLKQLGVQLAIDDFGMGYSALGYLSAFPVDELKIDKSFVDRMDTEPWGAVLIRTIISLGRSLDLRLVAEGIETPAQAEHLRRLGCDIGQGYYFSRPLPASELCLAAGSPRVAG